MKKIFFAIIFASASFAAQAGTISDLYNTGKGLSAGIEDQNYTVTGDEVDGYGYATENDVYPIGPWISNTSTSGWLSPSNNQGEGFSRSTYVWTTTFDLTGFDSASASFSGRFAADDNAFAYLNYNLIGVSNSFTNWSSFASQSDFFVEGINIIEFDVTNSGGGPTGLRVEFTASSETPIPSPQTAVPEPDTYATLLAGLGLMGFMVRRRKTS